jgi:Ala-tRNA(Pro) deacylase
MTNVSKLVKYLSDNGVDFRVQSHLPAYSAHNVAMATHVHDSKVAKVLAIHAGAQVWIAALRADHYIDQRLLSDVLETHAIRLASEEELEELFPSCEVGAMPPFGNLYGLPVLVDKALAGDEDIVFNACTHTESVRMKFSDYERLVKPMIVEFAVAQHRNEMQPRE